MYEIRTYTGDREKKIVIKKETTTQEDDTANYGNFTTRRVAACKQRVTKTRFSYH